MTNHCLAPVIEYNLTPSTHGTQDTNCSEEIYGSLRIQPDFDSENQCIILTARHGAEKDRLAGLQIDMFQ